MYGVFEVRLISDQGVLRVTLSGSETELPRPSNQTTESTRKVAEYLQRTLMWQQLLQNAAMSMHGEGPFIILTVDFSAIDPAPSLEDAVSACVMASQVINELLVKMVKAPILFEGQIAQP